MPETAVNKDCHPTCGKNKIGFAKHRLLATPSLDFIFMKYSDKSQFRVPIVSGSDF